MTEQEAKAWLECIEFEVAPHTQRALIIAIKALEEIQQYRAIGTVEECREAVKKHFIRYEGEINDLHYRIFR